MTKYTRMIIVNSSMFKYTIKYSSKYNVVFLFFFFRKTTFSLRKCGMKMIYNFSFKSLSLFKTDFWLFNII